MPEEWLDSYVMNQMVSEGVRACMRVCVRLCQDLVLVQLHISQCFNTSKTSSFMQKKCQKETSYKELPPF